PSPVMSCPRTRQASAIIRRRSPASCGASSLRACCMAPWGSRSICRRQCSPWAMSCCCGDWASPGADASRPHAANSTDVSTERRTTGVSRRKGALVYPRLSHLWRGWAWPILHAARRWGGRRRGVAADDGAVRMSVASTALAWATRRQGREPEERRNARMLAVLLVFMGLYYPLALIAHAWLRPWLPVPAAAVPLTAAATAIA